MDNLKKKKLDRKRIALKQKHEVDYLRRVAKDIILRSNKLKLNKRLFMEGERDELVRFSNVLAFRKLAKAFLKLLEERKTFEKKLKASIKYAKKKQCRR